MREKEKIEVCFVSPFAYPLFNPENNLKFGGAEVQMYLVATELAKDESFDVNFVVLDLGQKKKEEYNGVKVHKAYKRGRSFFNLVIAPLKLIATLFKIDPDVVISRAAGVEVGFSCLYTKIFRKKFVYSIASNKDVDRSRFKGLRGKIFQYGFERADQYIAQSKKQKEILKESYNREFSNLVIIPNSFHVEDKSSNSKGVVLWVGSSIDCKRPEIFADLAEEFPEERFVMIMTKSKAAPEKWKKIEQRAKDIKNLELIEQVPFQEIDDYFGRETSKMVIRQPLELTENTSKFDININVCGGGPSGQAGAIRHGITKALLEADPELRAVLKKAGYITRDSRVKERKKYGRKGARASFQFSKR